MKTINLDIGDKVKWKVGNKTRKGIFKQIINDTAEVITLFVENQPINIKVFVPLNILQLDN
jgi:hypothetical protein